jgi:hypothetical protein
VVISSNECHATEKWKENAAIEEWQEKIEKQNTNL